MDLLMAVQRDDIGFKYILKEIAEEYGVSKDEVRLFVRYLMSEPVKKWGIDVMNVFSDKMLEEFNWEDNDKQVLIEEDMLSLVSSPIEKTFRGRTSESFPGGIDFNPDYLDIQTQGSGINVSSPLNIEVMENIEINGLVPFIFSITPVNNLQLLLGVTKEEDDLELSLLEK